MADDGRKRSFSELDRLRRERRDGGGGAHGGDGAPRGARAREEEARRSQEALKAADSLFTDEKGGQEGKTLANAVRDAHGTAELPDACRRYLETVGPPASLDLASIFLDAGEKDVSLPVLDELLRQKQAAQLELSGGLKRQIRLLSEDFDDDLASRAEELLE